MKCVWPSAKPGITRPPAACRMAVLAPTYRAICAESPRARILPAAIATAPGWPRPVERPVQTGPPWMTMSALEPQAASRANVTTHHVPRTTHLLAELGDPADGVQRGDRVARCFRFWWRGSAQSVANIEEDFEQELFTLIGGIEIRHAAIVFRRLRTFVSLSINRIEIIKNLLSRPWTHSGERYRFRLCLSKGSASCSLRRHSTKISSCGIRRSVWKRRAPAPPLQEWARKPIPASAAIRSRSTPTWIESKRRTSTPSCFLADSPPISCGDPTRFFD